MRVRATRLGYYGDRRWREGQIFDLKDPSQFSKFWMEKVDDDSVEEPTETAAAAPAKNEHVPRKPTKSKNVI